MNNEKMNSKIKLSNFRYFFLYFFRYFNNRNFEIPK